MSRLRRISALALLLSGAFLGFAAGEARAGAIQMHLVLGATDFDLSKGSVFDISDPGNPNIVTIDSAALNSSLAIAGFNLAVAGLQALSNNPGDIGGAFLHESGTFQRTAAGPAASFTLYAFQTDYHTPSGGPGSLGNSSSTTFGFTAAGDTQSFKSWQDNTNVGVSPLGPPPTFNGTASPTLTFVSPDLVTGPDHTDSVAGNAPLTALASVAGSYAIENRFEFTISGGQPSIGFAGTSTVTSAVPEPASLALMLTSVPFLLAQCMMRRRKKTAV
jgi:hypothetical protein